MIVLLGFGLFQLRHLVMSKANTNSVLIEELLLTKNKYDNARIITSGYLFSYGENKSKFHYAIFSNREYYTIQNQQASINFSLDQPLDTKCFGKYVGVVGNYSYRRAPFNIFSNAFRELTDVQTSSLISNTPVILDNLLAADFYSEFKNAPSVKYQYEWASSITSKDTEDKLRNNGTPTHCYKEEGRDQVFENVTILDVATPQFGSGVEAVWAVVEVYVPNQFPEKFYIPYGGKEQKLPITGAKCTITSSWQYIEGFNEVHDFSKNDLYQVPTKIKCDSRAQN